MSSAGVKSIGLDASDFDKGIQDLKTRMDAAEVSIIGRIDYMVDRTMNAVKMIADITELTGLIVGEQIDVQLQQMVQVGLANVAQITGIFATYAATPGLQGLLLSAPLAIGLAIQNLTAIRQVQQSIDTKINNNQNNMFRMMTGEMNRR